MAGGEQTVDCASVIGRLHRDRNLAEADVESGRETCFEWLPWLAERMTEREPDADPIPAHVEHRNWKER